jgi:hypothetical protein
MLSQFENEHSDAQINIVRFIVNAKLFLTWRSGEIEEIK